jgi:pyridoxal phosphate enzyme (YggS family)
LKLGVRENIQNVRRRIREAALRAGRRPEEVTLVAVSKFVPPETVLAAMAEGVTDLGESRIQEALPKMAAVNRPELNWHLIGNLQTNKVKQAVPAFGLIHSLDRWRLAEALELRGQEVGTQIRVLIEVNVSGETTKHGLAPAQLRDFLTELKKLPHLLPCGLMTMAPYTPVVEETRPVFRGLKQLWVQMATELQLGEHWQHLSMGMSNDFEVAVEEGATLVRIGSAIFGAEVNNLNN